MAHISTPMDVSVLGCVVNGPGEAAQTVLGLTGGGNGRHKVYMGGKPDHNVTDAEMVDHFVALIEQEAEKIEAALEQ